MTDLRDLRAALDETVDRARPPGFEELEARARTRRRTRHGVVAAGVLVAVLVAAITGGLLSGAQVRRPAPATHEHPNAHHAQSSKPPASRKDLDALSTKQVVAGGHLYSYGSTGSDAILTVWQVCVHDSSYCRYAWRLAQPGGESAVGDAWTSDGATGPQVVPANGGYVLTTWDRRGLVVRDDGTATAVRPGPPQRIEDRIGVVRHGRAGLRAVDARTATSWPLPLPPGSDAVAQAAVSAKGTVWALPAFAGPGKVEVSRLADGRWQSHEITDPSSDLAVPGLVVASGARMEPTRVAVLSTYDGATSLPVGVLAVSQDSGRSWRQLPRAQLPFDTVDSMAADASGTLYVADPSGKVWRSVGTGWDRFVRVPGIRAFGLESAGEQVLAELVGGDHPQLALLDREGTVRRVAAR